MTLIVWLVIALTILVVLLVFLGGGFKTFGKTTEEEQAGVSARLCSRLPDTECVVPASSCTAPFDTKRQTKWIDCAGECCYTQDYQQRQLQKAIQAPAQLPKPETLI